MNKVFAILDAQGFIKDGEFRPREFSIRNDWLNIHSEVDSNLGRQTAGDMKTNIWTSMNKTGLPMYIDGEKRISIDQMKNLIYSIGGMLATHEKPYFGIKNDHLARLLDEMGLLYQKLELPPLSMMDKMYNNKTCCNLHLVNGTCASRKTKHILKYLKQIEKMEKICKNYK
jgi:hypothetical protein